MKQQIVLSGLLLAAVLLGHSQKMISQPGFYRVRIGKFEVVALSDGTFPADVHGILKEADSTSVNTMLHAAFLSDTTETSINAYLIKSAEKVILVDAGGGANLGNSCGKLITNLAQAGYQPEDITDILITHIHIDHVSGVSAGNRILFPNATVHINNKDLAFWQTHDSPHEDDTWGIKLNRPGYQALKPYITAGKVAGFHPAAELLPGVSAVEYAGHTPGHTVYLLEDGGEKIAFWGDLVHVAAVQFNEPAMRVEYDFDKNASAIQRERAYGEAAAHGYLIAASHISFPGIGRLRKNGHGFVWFPVPYSLYGKN